jgi:hypothetical protein
MAGIGDRQRRLQVPPVRGPHGLQSQAPAISLDKAPGDGEGFDVRRSEHAVSSRASVGRRQKAQRFVVAHLLSAQAGHPGELSSPHRNDELLVEVWLHL